MINISVYYRNKVARVITPSNTRFYSEKFLLQNDFGIALTLSYFLRFSSRDLREFMQR